MFPKAIAQVKMRIYQRNPARKVTPHSEKALDIYKSKEEANSTFAKGLPLSCIQLLDNSFWIISSPGTLSNIELVSSNILVTERCGVHH